MVFSDKTLTVAQDQPGYKIRPTLWMRTASGPQIGFGHLKRCLIMARKLRDCCSPIFLIDDSDRWSGEQIAAQGWNCCSKRLDDLWGLLPDPVGILIDTRVSLGLDRLISAARKRSIPVISIHDLGLNPLASDIIVDGSIAPLPESAIVPAAHYYRGTDFMVLDPAYSRLHKKQKQVPNRIGSVFINFGGGHSERFFLKVLSVLKQWSCDVEVIGVPGFIEWGQEELRKNSLVPANFRWVSHNIDRYLFQADLAITAGGISAYEALCTGTPLLALSYDSLQQSTIRTLAEKDACIDLGPGDQLDPKRLSEIISLLDANPERRRSLSLCGREVVDGRGAERISKVIRQSIRIREAEHDWRYCDAPGAGL